MNLNISRTVKSLLIFYVAMFVIEKTIDQYLGGNLGGYLALIPIQVMHGMIWQLLTYSFLHADPMHLILNCMVLAFLASDIEAVWGQKKFLIFYGFCTVIAGLFYFLVQAMIGSATGLATPLVGASGGIYGLLAAYAVLFAERQMLFMMMFPLKAKQFIWIIAGVEFLQAAFSGQGGLSAFAHLSGMGAGYGYMVAQTRAFRTIFAGKAAVAPVKKNKGHLRLVKTEIPEKEKDPKTWH